MWRTRPVSLVSLVSSVLRRTFSTVSGVTDCVRVCFGECRVQLWWRARVACANETERLTLKRLIRFQVVVEGNIGSGKTAFISHVAKNYPHLVATFPEPVQRWRNVRGHNLLELMYKEPRRWSFLFQQYVQLTMVELHEELHHSAMHGTKLKLMERSIYSARHCFVANLIANGLLAEQEVIVYDEWFRWLRSRCDIRIDLIVYLQSTPERCAERVKRRSRPEEAAISVSYLQQLHELHEQWLTSDRCPAPVFTISNAEDIQDEATLARTFEEAAPYLFGKRPFPNR